MFIKTFLNIVKKIDWLLLVAVFLLVGFGLASLYSLGLSQDDFTLFYKQIVFFAVGLIFVFLIASFNYRWWRFFSPWLYLLSLALLVLVLLFGTNFRGTTGWFVVGGISFQPVELAKLALIIFLARFFSSWSSSKGEKFTGLKSFLIILPALALVAIQPDFGSAAVILVGWFAMWWMYGINKKQFLILFLLFILVAVFAWSFMLQGYQKQRILTFLDTEADPLGSGYNVQQSMVAIGSGGLWGRGLGLGPQSQLHFLPISEADFIYAAISEELGFVGSIIILALYAFVFYRLVSICRKSRDDFGTFLVYGFLIMFFVQFVINIGMSVGMLPVTGLPLPFVSYGGSFLVMSFVAVGIIQSVKSHT